VPAESQGSTPLQPEADSAAVGSAAEREAVQQDQQPSAVDDDGWQVWRLPYCDNVLTHLLTQ
jgi:hypothetical protein